MEIASLIYYRLVKSDFIIVEYFSFLSLLKAIAALLGGCEGFSLISKTNKMNGMVTIMAYSLRNLMISSDVL